MINKSGNVGQQCCTGDTVPIDSLLLRELSFYGGYFPYMAQDPIKFIALLMPSGRSVVLQFW